MKRLIIFDLDGTLINTLEDLTNSVNYALDRFNYPPRTVEDTRKAIGNGVSKLIERSIPDGINNPHYERTLEVFKEHYSVNYCIKTNPYKGMQHVISRLKKDGYRLAVCTNKIQDVADILVKRFFGNDFDYIQGEVPGLKKKPAPDMIYNILRKFPRVRKDEVLYVGDTEVDEQTAFHSELQYVLVSYGYRTPSEQKLRTPYARIVRTPTELEEFIKAQD